MARKHKDYDNQEKQLLLEADDVNSQMSNDSDDDWLQDDKALLGFWCKLYQELHIPI